MLEPARLACVTRPRTLLAWLGLLVGLGLLARELMQQQAKRDASQALHCVEFLLLTLFAGRALAIDLRFPWWPPAAALVVALFGLLDEALQGLHPLRHFDPSDVLLNARIAAYGMLTLPALVGRARRAEFAEAPLAPGFSERPTESYVIEFLSTREGLELNKAFVKITDPRVRRSVVELVRALGGDDDAAD